MVVGNDQAQPLFVEAAADEVRGVRDGRGEAEVEAARPQALDHRLAVVLDELEADPGVVDPEGADEGGHRLGAHRVEEAEGDLARCRVGVGADRVGGLLDLGQRAFGRAEEGAAGGGEGDGPAPAGEQGDAQVLFEPDHGARQGRLRDSELVRGAGDVLVPGHGLEVREAWGEHGPDVFFVTAR